MNEERPPQLDPELVQAFVGNAHGDLGEVERLLAQEPSLVNAAWDWGRGDWETGLGAAAHVGEREIALFLLEHGARLDLFAAAMLGYADVVRTVLEAHPQMRDAKGPHGIPLIAHAQKGGEQAHEVRELLEAAPVPAG
jgi:hypothetical protein